MRFQAYLTKFVFSPGRFTAETDEQGNFFIDRSGEKFRSVLEFLRTGSLEQHADWDALLHEAQFYLLDDLVSAIEERKQAEEAARTAVAPTVRCDGIYRSPTGRCFAFIDDHRYVTAAGASAFSNIVGFLLGSPTPAKWQQTGLAEEFAVFCVNNAARGTYWLENGNKMTLLVENSKYVAAVAAGDVLYLLHEGKFIEYAFVPNSQLSKRPSKPTAESSN